MDPNPKTFPILSYVMSSLDSKSSSTLHRSSSSSISDLEQPPIKDKEKDDGPHLDLAARMPHLADPAVMAAMKAAVSEVAQTRSILHSLGDRPDHESIDLARSHIANIDDYLIKTLDHLALAPRPAHVDAAVWRKLQADKEKQFRDDAEKEKLAYKSVIRVYEMHDAYENLLKEAEERLVRIYEGHDHVSKKKEAAAAAEDRKKKAIVEEEEVVVDEEVIRILKRGEAQRINLVGRQLRFLPEAFGRIYGLVVLDVSNNQLEVNNNAHSSFVLFVHLVLDII